MSPAADAGCATGSAGSAGLGVLLPRGVEAPFDYLAPPDLSLSPGDYVEVPLRSGRATGVVWGPGGGEVPVDRMKPVAARLDLPPMPLETRRFLERAASYTITPLGTMLSLSVRPGWLRAAPPERLAGVRRTGLPLPRTTPSREAVLRAYEASGASVIRAAELAERAGVGVGVIDGLVRAGAFERAPAPGPGDAAATQPVALNAAQAEAAESLAAAVGGDAHRTILLQGVTGSGKTEVYLEAVRKTVELGRQALVLLPEIALTDSFVRRIAARMGALPVVWHSRLVGGPRRRAWRAVTAGDAAIVAGARSALFLPFRDLGLIVVDEEHDSGYKQEDRVIYSARDMAVLRADTAGVPAVLATATPSLESFVNAKSGRYARLSLPKRFGEAELPEVRTVDTRAHRPERGRWLAPPTVRAVRETLDAGGQVLLFLNRRGYAPLLICHECGHRVGCLRCDVSLVAHRTRKVLLCHHCGYEEREPDACPQCGSVGSLAPCGPGVERLAEETRERFPDLRVSMLSSDSVGGAALRSELDALAAGEVDVCVGTQIVAKGHHFPHLRLVGVIDTDMCLSGGDFRAGERTFQIVRQVTGRAGRAGGRSLALLQTAAPQHPVVRAIVSGDEEAFLTTLKREREAASAPPFHRYVAVVVSSTDRDAASAVARALERKAEMLENRGIRLLGPVRAPIARLRDRWRWRFLASAARNRTMQRHLVAWRDSVRAPANVRVALDVDPQSFL